MFIEELAPKNDFRKFVPEFFNHENVIPESLVSLGPYLRDQKMNAYQAIGFITGIMDLQRIITDPDNDKKGRYHRWFATSEVVDIRVLFRNSNNDSGRSIGSKVRLYSMAKRFEERKRANAEETVQHIDSGFLKYNRHLDDPDMVFQNAMASTMFYRAAYCIGGPATVRRISVPEDSDKGTPAFKWMSAVKPKWSDDIDFREYTHILHPALNAAGVPRDFFEDETLDAIVDIFLDSRDIKDVEKGFLELPGEEFDASFVRDIIANSNNDEANLSNSSPEDFDNHPGLNLVGTLRFLYESLDEEEDY